MMPLPQRTDTPPRSGSAPIRLLRICLDEGVLGAVECNESSTLADVRVTIAEDEIAGVPPNYRFLFGGAPVSRRQEGRRRAVDCFPFLTIIQEDVQIPPPTTALGSPDAGGETPSTHGLPAGLPFVAPHGGQRASFPGIAGGTAAAGAAATVPELAAAEAETAHLGEPPHEPGAGQPAVVSGSATLELHITDGPLEGTTVTVGEEGARIGRHTSNTVVIPEAGISRYHCEICYIGGDFCVRDLGSTTGTYFYLRPHGHFQMFTGLLVKLGETEFQVLSSSPQGAEHTEQVMLFYEGPLQGQKVHVPASGITIGRRHDNNLVLVQDGTVSAHHAMIFCEDGDFFITDLGSCNGTCVRLSMERNDSDWHPIMDGDILGAGCTKVRCRVSRGL